MLICGLISSPDYLKDSQHPCELTILTFDGKNQVVIERECHESQIMAEFYCDTRGIVMLKEPIDYMVLVGDNAVLTPESISVHSAMDETAARRYLFNRNYNL